jgi:hypothetical protein
MFKWLSGLANFSFFVVWKISAGDVVNGSQGSAWIKSSVDVPKKLGVLMSFHISRFTPAPLCSCFSLCFALGRARAPSLFVIYVPRMICTWQYRIAQCICSDVDAYAHANALRTLSTCKHTSYIQHNIHMYSYSRKRTKKSETRKRPLCWYS